MEVCIKRLQVWNSALLDVWDHLDRSPKKAAGLCSVLVLACAGAILLAYFAVAGALSSSGDYRPRWCQTTLQTGEWYARQVSLGGGLLAEVGVHFARTGAREFTNARAERGTMLVCEGYR